MVNFIDSTHTYYSPEYPDIKWTSVTSVVHNMCQPFEWTAEQSSLKKPTAAKPNKWYQMDPKEIQAAWDAERDRSTNLGTWYHNKRENALLSRTDIPIHPPKYKEGEKISLPQKLVPGIYPEHLVYLMAAGICGQSDLVTVTDKSFSITDYKTSKEIKRKGVEYWDKKKECTVVKKMLGPCKHLDDCEFYHYAVQLSLYAYMVWRANPKLEIDKLTIEHVKFEEEGKNKYDYPIYRKDDNGDYIVKDIEYIDIPYLGSEAQNIINSYRTKK